jgi:ribose/xylose/arabinose/galactoside ABC-type transport system permease subunit
MSRPTDRRGRRDEPAMPDRATARRTGRADSTGSGVGRAGRVTDSGIDRTGRADRIPGRVGRTTGHDNLTDSGVGRVNRVTGRDNLTDSGVGRVSRVTGRDSLTGSGVGRVRRVSGDLTDSGVGRIGRASGRVDLADSGVGAVGRVDDRPGRPRRGARAPDTADRDDRGDGGPDEASDLDAPTPPHGIPVVKATPRVSVARETDRVWVHVVWEALLLAAVAGAAVALSVLGADAFSGRSLDLLLVQVAGVGLVATGLACSLRAAVPNLAVGAIAASAATLAGRVMAEDVSFMLAALVVLTGALLVGLVLAVVVVGLQVPAWAASLGIGLLVVALATAVDGRQGRPVREAGAVTDAPWLWFGVFVLVSVAGGAVCAAPEVRRWLGGMRGDRDPGQRPTGGAAAGAALALVGSTVLAAAGGLVLSAVLGFAEPANPLGVLLTALAAVLLGGVSAFGRRAGVFGTVLGVLLVLLVLRIVTHLELDVRDAVLGAAIVLGLAVNRALEATGRRTAGR